MAEQEKTPVRVGKQTVEVTNLDRLLYPEAGIVKAEVIQYTLSVATPMLRHLKGRPVALVRFPEGIHGERFFQKNMPKWAPKWVPHYELGDEKKIDYVVPDSPAVLVWLANQAALELHVMNVRKPHIERPDYIAFDIDPPEGQKFSTTIAIALDLKAHLESFGYTPFAKTSGQKGIHLLVPLEPKWDVEKCFEVSKELGASFVKKNDRATMFMAKDKRQGKTLIDVYRNGGSQTMVAAYSLRGNPGATVSMPLPWPEIEALESGGAFDIHTAPAYLEQHGDPWENVGAHAAALHTERPTQVQAADVPNLEKYGKKRDFSKTPEPVRSIRAGKGDAFVVQRHDATRLHYDLRLEENGALRSWAVPRGLPPYPGIKRLAVAVEDHPLDYLTFEGTIPKGNYGAGEVWVFTTGRYETTKHSDKSIYFQLFADDLTGEYRIFHTRENEWILERLDEPSPDLLRKFVEPMAADVAKSVPAREDDYWYELKWDGIRVVLTIDEGKITLHTRNGNDITAHFAELTNADDFRTDSGVFDGEIVCLDADGRPQFENVLRRMQGSRVSACAKAVCYLFDCITLDGKSLVRDPLERRREYLETAIKGGTQFRISKMRPDGKALLKAVTEMGLEGIMAKRRGSFYHPGTRHSDWLKVKVVNTVDCLVVGYSPGAGARQGEIGALHVAQEDDGELVYRGKVGTGFNEKSLREIKHKLDRLPRAAVKVRGRPTDRKSTWVEPVVACEIKYTELTGAGVFRAPVFLRLRPDLSRSPV